jgi:hypothetical protein
MTHFDKPLNRTRPGSSPQHDSSGRAGAAAAPVPRRPRPAGRWWVVSGAACRLGAGLLAQPGHGRPARCWAQVRGRIFMTIP